MIKKLCILSILALFLSCGAMLFAEENGLARIVDQKNPIKVYIKGNKVAKIIYVPQRLVNIVVG